MNLQHTVNGHSRGTHPAIVINLLLLAMGAVLMAAPAAVNQQLGDRFPAMARLIESGEVRASAAREALHPGAAPVVSGFQARHFADGYRLRSGSSAITLRPELGDWSGQSAAMSGATYANAFPGVTAFRGIAAGSEAEVFVADSAAHAKSIAYRVGAADDSALIVNDGRGIRFVSGHGPDAFLSAPVVVDSRGRVSLSARWAVDRTDRGTSATLRVQILDRSLVYPVAVAYAPGRRAVASHSGGAVTLQSGSVSGNVNAGGSPIGGAQILLFDSSGDLIAAAVTDAAGNYSIGGLDTDQYRALITADGFVTQLYSGIPCPDGNCSPIDGTPISVADGANTSGVNFTLQAEAPTAATITGTVSGPGGSPLGDVTVVLFDGSGTAVESASSASNGSYQITLDHGGTFYARTFNGTHQGLVDELYAGINCVACNPTTGTAITATPGATTGNINFSLVAGGTISGRVTDAFDSSGLPTREVLFYNASGVLVTTATTDDSGNYTSFNGLTTGTYHAVARASGFFSQTYNGIDCTACTPSSGTPISVTLGSSTSSINFPLHSSQAIVTGTVTDASTHDPLGGVLIVFYDSTGHPVLATTSQFSDGAYTIYLPAAGNYYALTQNGLQQSFTNQVYNGIDCSGCLPTSGTAIHVALGTPVSNVNFALHKAGGKISGTILDATTSGPAEFGFVQVFSSNGILAAYGFSDSSGNYTVSDGLTSGTYYVIGRAPGHISVLYNGFPCATGCSVTTGTPVTVTAGQTTAGINFNLGTTAAAITGHVFAAVTATPLAGVDVGVFDSSKEMIATGTSDASGNYTVSLHAGGTYFARTLNTTQPAYHDQVWDHLTCEDCDATTGTPISVTDGTTVANINFDLHTTVCPTITLSPSSLPDTTIGASYTQTLTASGGATPVTFDVTAGALPAGISLGSNGGFSGAASTTGSFTFSVTGTDANGCSGSATYTINVSAGPTTTTLSASPTSAVFGTVVTVTATVSPSAATGAIAFFDGTTQLAVVTVSGGSASTTLSSLTAGSHNLTARYNGSSTYAPSTSAAVQVTISQATPLITWPPPAPITYGTALSATQLNATANVPGSFVYNPPAGTILDAGTQLLGVTFNPADSLNYRSTTATVSLTVNKADQTINWTNPADIVYGTALSATQLNATVTVPGPSPAGALAYNPPAGTVLNAGAQTLTVTAAATSNYNQATKSVQINVLKATPVFSNVTAPVVVLATPSAPISGVISVGTLIPSGSVTITLNGVTISVPIQSDGSFSATLTTGAFPIGSYAVTLAYAGDSNFNGATGSSTLTVIYDVTGGANQSKPANAGSTIPFRVTLVDAAGTDVSSSTIAVTAYGVQLNGSTTWLPIAPLGNASANFRFQNSGNDGSYVFNLKTTGLASGNYVLGFNVAGDPTIHTVPFAIK